MVDLCGQLWIRLRRTPSPPEAEKKPPSGGFFLFCFWRRGVSHLRGSRVGFEGLGVLAQPSPNRPFAVRKAHSPARRGRALVLLIRFYVSKPAPEKERAAELPRSAQNSVPVLPAPLVTPKPKNTIRILGRTGNSERAFDREALVIRGQLRRCGGCVMKECDPYLGKPRLIPERVAANAVAGYQQRP